MIGRLTGTLVECRPDEVLLDVSGVGYRVQIPLSTYYPLADRIDRPATLQIHTYVREEALNLYGFLTAAERSTFEKLIATSGVGPRLALALLSGIGVDELRECVMRQDRARLQKVPGVGKKTAERLLLELRDRLVDPAREPTSAPAAAKSAGTLPGELRGDAVSALTNLGYGADAAKRAVDSALTDPDSSGGTLESVLRLALATLSR